MFCLSDVHTWLQISQQEQPSLLKPKLLRNNSSDQRVWKHHVLTSSDSPTSLLYSQDCWSRQGPFTRVSTQNWTVRVKCCETLWYCSVAVTTDTAWVVSLLCFSGIFLKTDLRYRRELFKEHWCISQLFTVTGFCSSFRDLKHSLEQKIRYTLWIHRWI